MKKPLSVVFAGTPEFGLPCLEALLKSNHHLKAVYTQPDRGAGRGRRLQVSAVKKWAEQHLLPVYQPLNFKDPTTIQTLKALAPDVMVVIAYGLILPQAVLDIPRFGCINVHASLLPRWRGASPIQQAILHNDATSGITIMQMDAGMDTGAVIATTSYALAPFETAASLSEKLATLAAPLLMDVLDTYALAGKVSLTMQDHAKATLAKKIHKQDGQINWQNAASVIAQQIKAYNPWPIAYTTWMNTPLRIYRALVVESMADTNKAPGTVLAVNREGIVVATGQHALCLTDLQLPGGKPLKVTDWLNSNRPIIEQGQCLV
ncbi:MAG: methionyl-tRNA formyltransferase [Legionellaceae bacterium]|nr:methionyl-tRNA formyltransferase [Legionellaceae bacterium]HCA89382.1 methionyl-tRNA formyltransferase [Legionellales bacterium]|tara:strand:+ start:264 stop:1220 length:957 start_codon:yes stop_codon:yes gene_type:complete